MRKNQYIILLLFFSCQTAVAQHETMQWYFGEKSGMDFTDLDPKPLSDGKINTLEGCATMSDRITGRLLFYTDGMTIWNKNHEVMKNGTKLKGGTSSTQSALIVPNPGNNLEYYVFTSPSRTDSIAPPKLYYSIVSLEDPNGDVIRKNILLQDSIGEKLTATLECHTGGFWILSHHIKKAKFYAFHLTVNGLSTKPVVSDFRSEYSGAYAGYLKFSPSGMKIATGMGVFNKPSKLCLFDFDKTNGIVSNRKIIDEGSLEDFYGISFSPDNSKLYATSREGIWQYDVANDDSVTIRNSKVKISPPLIGALQLARDRKIYISPFKSNRLHIINNPNNKGNACSYAVDSTPCNCQYGLPNFMDYYFSNDFIPFSSCFNYIGKIDTVRGCPGTTLTIAHKLCKGASEWSWKIDNAHIILVRDSIIKCVINQMGKHVVRLTYRYKNFIDTMYSVVIINKPIANAGEDGYFCNDTTSYYQLGDKPIKGNTYHWFPPEGLSDPSISNPIVRITKTQQYILMVTNEYDCTSFDTVFVTRDKVIIPKVSGEKIICRGHAVQLSASGGNKYTWSPSVGLDDTTKPNPVATPLKTTRYKVIVSMGTCRDSAYVNVIVRDHPTINTGAKTICKGQKTQLFTSGGISYQWSPAKDLDNPNKPNPIAAPKETTTYKVIVTYNNCIDSAFVTVNVKDSPKADAGMDRVICPGTPIRLGIGKNDSLTYSWIPPLYLDSTSVAQPVCKPLKSTKYILTVGNSNGCSHSDTVSVTVAGSLSIDAFASDTVLCYGEGTILRAEGAESYEWLPHEGLDNPYSATPIAKPQKTMKYYVIGKIADCIGKDSVLINVVHPPSLSVSPQQSICFGDSITLFASGAESFEWSPKEGLNDPFIPNPVASPTKSTLYTVIGRNGDCSDTGSVLVSVLKKPILKLSHERQLCSGDSITLAVSDAEYYDWFPKDSILFSNTAYPIVFPQTTTTYYVKGTTSTCSVVDSVTVTVFQKPKLSVSDSGFVCLGGTATLKAEGAESYHWLPHTGLDNPFSATPNATPSVSTTYTVFGTSKHCTDSASVTVIVRDTTQFPFTLSILGNNPFPVGALIPILVHIPTGIDSFRSSIFFEGNCLYYKGSSENSLKSFDIIESEQGLLHITPKSSGIKENTILLYFTLLLPPDGKLYSTIRIDDITVPEICSRILNNEVIIEYEPSCSWSLRGVESFSPYNVSISNNKIILYTGIGGYTTLTIYDLKGNKLWGTSQTTLPSSLLEYEIPQLSTGVFILQTHNFDYKSNVIFTN